MTGVILVIPLLLYSLLIGWISIGWFRLRRFDAGKNNPVSKVTVVVAMRNEEQNIVNLLNDLSLQEYPAGLFEVIIVDDHSDDISRRIVSQWVEANHSSVIMLSLVDTEKSGKKAAIDLGIQHASGVLIVTTDADCRLPARWLCTLAAYYERYHPKMILAPVHFSPSENLFTKLQALEFMSLMASTAGSAGMGIPLLANGANLAYERSAYLRCGGFTGNAVYPSGDDVFMLFRIRQVFGRKSILFIKSAEASVTTAPLIVMEEFMNQRLRWVSKSRGYTYFPIIISSLIVYLTNLAMLAAFFSAFISRDGLYLAFSLYLWKLIIDLPVLTSTTGFFRSYRLAWLIPVLEILNSVYTVYVGIAGNLKSVTWKGRKSGRKYQEKLK